jgi:hypothetical protein
MHFPVGVCGGRPQGLPSKFREVRSIVHNPFKLVSQPLGIADIEHLGILSLDDNIRSARRS